LYYKSKNELIVIFFIVINTLKIDIHNVTKIVNKNKNIFENRLLNLIILLINHQRLATLS